MQSENKVGVIIVNYNTSVHVIACIKSLDDESLNCIVVVDNHSPDDNPESILNAFPGVKLIRNDQNVGFGEGCNVGMRWLFENTDAEYVLFLNPDTVIKAGMISQLENHLKENGIGVVAPMITMQSDPGTLWYGGGNFSWLKGSARIPGYGKSSGAPLALLERDVQFASGCAFMTTRSVLLKCGGFDSRYFMYEEDVEFSLRIIANGYRIRYVPGAIVLHAAQGSQLKDEKAIGMFNPKNPRLPFFVFYAARNRFLTVFKHGSFFNRIIFIIGFTAWFTLKSIGWIRYFRFDAFAALFRGLKDFSKIYYSGESSILKALN